ncbi:unnamed protein product [Heterosigma akashiwo]
MELLADGGNTMNKWCVEFGAWDGKHLSNTWSLINEHGWSSVQIEGDPENSKSWPPVTARILRSLVFRRWWTSRGPAA